MDAGIEFLFQVCGAVFISFLRNIYPLGDAYDRQQQPELYRVRGGSVLNV